MALEADGQSGIGRVAAWRSAAGRDAPGLVTAAAATLAAAFLADHYGAPLTLMALLVGLAMNFLGADARLAPGLAFASRTLLRIGIVLVGLRITTGQIADLGIPAFIAIAATVAITILSGVLAARWLGFSPAFGALAGGAVGICGASAALAFATLLGEKRAGQAQLTLVLVGISAMSAFAMFAYPIIAHALGLGDRAAGYMLGASIHDVAQALGAGYSFSQEAGATAAVVKLTRVALLAPALACVALFLPREPGARRIQGGIPWFVIAFFVVAAINSTGIVPERVSAGGADVAAALLACAVAATGIRSPMQELLRTGPRPLLVIAAATLVALLLSVAAARYLIG